MEVTACRRPTEAAPLVLSLVPQSGSSLPDFFLSVLCQHFTNQIQVSNFSWKIRSSEYLSSHSHVTAMDHRGGEATTQTG